MTSCFVVCEWKFGTTSTVAPRQNKDRVLALLLAGLLYLAYLLTFSGVVRSSDIEAGRIISANEVAVSLYDDTALDVRFTLTDAQYGRVATDNDPLIGRDVDIIWAVGGIDYAYRAKVVRIGAEVASARGGVDVYARIEDGASAVQIRPGAFVEVTVPDRLYRDAYRLPETAIYDAGAVYIIEDGLLQRREVNVAAFDGADVIVTEGLSPGDSVLLRRPSGN